MKKILISSSNKDVLNAVKNACMTYSDYFDPLYSPDTDETMSLMDYEIPEVKVLDFSSKDIDNFRILSAINMDPWFHNGGVIAIAEDPRQAQELEDMKNQNILIVQTLHSFISSFSRLLRFCGAISTFYSTAECRNLWVVLNVENLSVIMTL